MDLYPEFNLLSRKLLPEVEISSNISNKTTFITTVAPHIAYLLDNDFQKLVQIMYRIDVSEKEFALTLSPNGNKNIAVALSEMIFDRLLLKAQYRAKYKTDKNA